MQVDLAKFADTVFESVKVYVEKQVQLSERALFERLDALIKALPSPKDGAVGRDGVDGKSINVDEIRQLVALAVSASKPKDGVDGKDGVSVKGETGDKGDKGDRGEKGEAAVLLVGEGPPLFAGKEGVVYLDSLTADLYRCNAL